MPGRPPVCKPSASFLRYDRAEDGRKGLRWYPAERVNRYAAPGRRPFVCRPRKREPPALQGSRSVAGVGPPGQNFLLPPPLNPSPFLGGSESVDSYPRGITGKQTSARAALL